MFHLDDFWHGPEDDEDDAAIPDPFGSRSRPRFVLVIVTRTARELVEDLEAACFRLNSVKCTAAAADAYGELCLRRKALYQYLEHLEKGVGLTRNRDSAVLRFD